MVKRKWEGELASPIKWTGPKWPAGWPQSGEPMPEAIGMPLLDIPPTPAEKYRHKREFDEAAEKVKEERLKKIPLLAMAYG